jgi:RNA polymerase sigma factor (sigma-70 family)
MVAPDENARRDEELISLYKKQGALDILGKLYDPYMPMVYGVCLKYLKDREESKDAVMQIFEKLVESLKRHEVANFRSWLYVIAKNHCLMQLRAAKGKQFEDFSPLTVESEAPWHPDGDAGNEGDLLKLEKCLETLGAEQKWCVQLFYLKQKCYKEISTITGYDDLKVKSYIQNGKRNLRICMERNG